MALTDIAQIMNYMKQAGLKPQTKNLVETLMNAVESSIRTETGRRMLEANVHIKLDDDLNDSQTDVDILASDYGKVEVDDIILCDSEQMKITAKGGSPELTVERGYGNTIKATHTKGTSMKVVGLEEFHNGDGETGWLYTREYPIIGVTSLYDDTERVYGSDTLIDTADYEWYRNGKIELVSGYFYKGLKNIKIVYNAGFCPIPDDLQRLATTWTIEAFKGLPRIGVSSISGPDGSITVFREFLEPEMKRTLKKYRRPLGGN